MTANTKTTHGLILVPTRTKEDQVIPIVIGKESDVDVTNNCGNQ
jgi:hypothetical protein